MLEDPKRFRPEDPGPEFVRTGARGGDVARIAESAEWSSITWRTSAPGVPAVTTTLTVYADLDVIDLDVDLVKPAHDGPESIFVAFPFALTRPRFLLETAGAVYEAEAEQLPDTSKDWYSIQHAVGVTGDDAGVLWGSLDAPLVQVGGFHTGEWARRLEVRNGSVNSWLMNNLHFTNFQARQDGTRRYRYRFAPTPAPVRHRDVRVFGRNLAEPLAARWYTGPVSEGATGLRVEPADRLLAEVRPEGGAVRIRLRNVDAEAVTATVAWSGTSTDVAVPGFGSADVRLLPP
jgi:hypothetical protein